MCFDSFGWKWADLYSPVHFRIHPAALFNSHINKHKGTSFTGSRTSPGDMSGITNSSLASPHSSLDIILVRAHRLFHCQHEVWEDFELFWQTLFRSSCLRITNCLRLVIKAFVFTLIRSRFNYWLINMRLSSWWVHVIWSTVAKGVFLHQRMKADRTECTNVWP